MLLVTKQLMVAIDFYSIFNHTMEVNGYHQLFGNQHSSKYPLLCSTEDRNSYMFGISGGWVNDFWVNYPFSICLDVNYRNVCMLHAVVVSICHILRPDSKSLLWQFNVCYISFIAVLMLSNFTAPHSFDGAFMWRPWLQLMFRVLV